jgi:hypothetical protein
LVSISFARAAEPAPRIRAAARAILALVNMVVSPVELSCARAQRQSF